MERRKVSKIYPLFSLLSGKLIHKSYPAILNIRFIIQPV